MKIKIFLISLVCIYQANSFAQFSKDIIPERDITIFSNFVDNSDALGIMRSGTICDSNERRALIYFPIADSIPANATITSVTLDIDFIAGGSSIGNQDTFSIHLLQEDWGEGTSYSLSGAGVAATTDDATWNDRFFGSASAWTSPGGTFVAAPSASAELNTTAGPFSWTSAQMVTEVQDWLDNPANNFGWILISELQLGCTARKFGSKDSLTAPVLHIDYDCFDSLGCFTSFEKIPEIDFNLYPNPSNGEVQLEAPLGSEIEVIGLNGKKLIEQKVISNLQTIDLTCLAEGVYLIKVITKNGVRTRMIVIEY